LQAWAGHIVAAARLQLVLLTGLHSSYSTDYHRIWLKGATWATGGMFDFAGNLDHIMSGLGLG